MDLLKNEKSFNSKITNASSTTISSSTENTFFKNSHNHIFYEIVNNYNNNQSSLK
jgi:hypothetical protein